MSHRGGCAWRRPVRSHHGSAGAAAGAGTVDQVIDSTPALGEPRYARAVTSVSGI